MPPGCPTPNPIRAIPEQVIAIQSVRFGESPACTGSSCPEIVLRNVSNAPLTIPGGETGWNWCNVPGYYYVSPVDVTLAPDQTFAFVPLYRTSIRPLYRGDDPGDTNEVGIYISQGVFDEPDKIRAFVEWGEGSGQDTRESIGSMSFLWTYGERITIDPGDEGFVAIGKTDIGAGYTSVPRRCLITPP